MKAGGSFSKKDYEKGTRYEKEIIKKLHRLGINARRNKDPETKEDVYKNAKYGDIVISYNNGNELLAEAKSSTWIPYNQTMITRTDIYIFHHRDSNKDFVCTDVKFIKNKLSEAEKKRNLYTSRGTRGKEEAYKKDHRIVDPEQPGKEVADLGYRFKLNEFPSNSLTRLEVYFQDPSFH